ncbi:MAG: carboxypeptidase-like regulatory domain-containing protein [Planctomycetota bacterium]
MRSIGLLVLAAACVSAPAQDTEQKKTTWSAQGRVIDGDGNAMPGVTVSAATGWGSLRQSGRAVTDADGRYEFDFGPGMLFAGEDHAQLQAATFFARKQGYFEKNLCRQGDLRMARRIPEEVTKAEERSAIILPGKPRTINFVMLPAVKLAGRIIDENGEPLAGYGVSLKGDDMPPSSSVAGSAKSDDRGRFEMDSVPTGFEYQLLIQPTKRHWPWNAWASGPLKVTASGPSKSGESESGERIANLTDGSKTYPTSKFVIQLQSGGVNWKRALQIANEHQSIELRDKQLLLTLSPPGEDQSKREPESIELSVGLASQTFDPAHRTTIDLTERRGLTEIPDSVAWPFVKVQQVRTKLSSTFDVNVFLSFLGDKDANRRVLVELSGIDDGGGRVFRDWSVVADQTEDEDGLSRTKIEVPRLLLSELAELQIGVRELTPGEVDTYPLSRSRTNVRVTKSDDEQRVTVLFDNPQDNYSGKPMSLSPQEHQVIFQVVTRDEAGGIERKLLRQLAAKERGGYEERIALDADQMDRSSISMTFVTIQPNHDQWVDRFFRQGKGTSYSGMWIGDGTELKRAAKIR